MTTTAPFQGFNIRPPYRRIDNFLGQDMVGRLLDHVAARQQDFVPTRVGRAKLNPAIRESLLLRDFGDLRDELDSRLSSVLDWAVREMRMSRIDLARTEMELVAHGDGAFYSAHIDTAVDLPDAASDRALTGVYYFHRRPKGFDGGALRLHAISPGGGDFVDIPPSEDMLVLFPAWAPHEVRPISCPSGAFMDSRFSINCWFRHRRS